MGEPVTLYRANGDSVTVYTNNAREARLVTGEWFATEAEAQSHAAPQPPAPEPEPEPAPPKTKRPVRGKAGQ